MNEVVSMRTNSQAPVGRNMDERPSVPSDPVRRIKPKRNLLKFVALIASVLVVVGIIALGIMSFINSGTGSAIDGSKYQALFLTNGQVYFGKLHTLNGDYMKLTDIYYLQAKTTDSSNPQETTDQSMADVQLIKLGNEIHGPDDSMIINRDQILFFENLKKDSKVSTSISQYKG